MAQGKFLTERRHVIAQRDHLLTRRGFVIAVDNRRGLRLQRLCRCDIGGNHKVFDHTVRIKPLAHGDLCDLAFVIEHHAALGQFQLQRIALLSRFGEQFPRAPQIGEILWRIASIYRALRIFIGNIVVDAHCTARVKPRVST